MRVRQLQLVDNDTPRRTEEIRVPRGCTYPDTVIRSVNSGRGEYELSFCILDRFSSLGGCRQ